MRSAYFKYLAIRTIKGQNVQAGWDTGTLKMQTGWDTGTPKMRTIWETGTLIMQTKMLGHRDTKNPDRLGTVGLRS